MISFIKGLHLSYGTFFRVTGDCTPNEWPLRRQVSFFHNPTPFRLFIMKRILKKVSEWFVEAAAQTYGLPAGGKEWIATAIRHYRFSTTQEMNYRHLSVWLITKIAHVRGNFFVSLCPLVFYSYLCRVDVAPKGKATQFIWHQ